MSHQQIDTNEAVSTARLKPSLSAEFQTRSNQRQSRLEPESPVRRRGFQRIVVFFLFVLGLIYLLDWAVDSGLRRLKTSGFGVTNRIMGGEINADILITGSSRALTHYDSRIIQEKTGRTTYNIGLNGSQTDMQLAMLEAYLRHNTRPSLLIHNLDLFSFQTTHGGVFDPGQYLPYMNEPAIYGALKSINSEAWKSKFLPLYGYAVEDLRFTWTKGIRGLLGWNPTEDHFLGFKPRYTTWTGDFERFKVQNPEGVRFEVEPKGVEAMQELLHLCRSRGIAVLLVYSPEYLEMQTMTTNRTNVFTRFRELGEEFSATIWDYSASSISSSKDYFYNSQHLNAEGATAFSKEIADRISSDTSLRKLLGSNVVLLK